ncbi:hypothetical protein DWU98_05035 [Dyella monticola]|uniref:Uncharacterized protein n=1 Tax=Dyella monticola TaxID=1927958 RepID=A0A370X5T1_9GAMM|nr:hypothetical protein [Dyella monticola]RDS83692.1 hypothetical protein DWU98_05035 [Dyella monticola]
MNTPRDLLYEGNHLLSHDHYLELCDIRDKLLLMAQLAGSSTSLNDPHAMLYIRRALLGEMLGNLSFQLNVALFALERVDAAEVRASTE